jgi:CheY-like chemotaxis protein
MGASPVLLLVEDNEDDVFLMMRALKNAQVDLPLQTASDGQQAMEYLAALELPPDASAGALPAIVFLDINLPQTSGFELLTWIRARPETRNLIVIMLTSSNHPMDIRRAYELGANSYVVKPASYEQLTEFARLFKGYWLSCNRSPV